MWNTYCLLVLDSGYCPCHIPWLFQNSSLFLWPFSQFCVVAENKYAKQTGDTSLNIYGFKVHMQSMQIISNDMQKK